MTGAIPPAAAEEIPHPRDWTEEVVRDEIGGPYAEHASDPDFCQWLKESLTEAIERSLPDGYRSILPRRHTSQTNVGSESHGENPIP